MADDRYGGYGRRERESSIFSDDDDDRWDTGSSRRWSGDYGRERGRSDDDRGFFERAGDEVRSWFGDEEAERRRERDVMRDDARSAFTSRDEDRPHEGLRGGGIRGGYGSSFETRGRSDLSRGGWGSDRERGGFAGSRSVERGGRGAPGRQGFGGGRSPWDDNYRHWRDQQIQQFDSEYEDFCRERQQLFDQDFDRWRSSRLTEDGPTSGGGGSSSGMAAGGGTRTQPATGSTRSVGSEGTGSTGATGSMGDRSASETGGAMGAGPTESRSRGGRSRT